MLGTGLTGFIGSALADRFDIRLVTADALPRVHADYFFHFGSPSSNILFNEDNRCIRETVDDFLKVVEYCKRRHLKLIFPSSATVYKNNNNYAHTKSALEQIAEAYELPFLALRIFAGYGVGEGHKKHYASVIYQWVKDMTFGKAPVIFGDGTQSRDFVYIDDIVNTIALNLDAEGFLDIGTGVNTSFNEVVEIINEVLGTEITPEYVDKPQKYVEETVCLKPLREFVPVAEGIKRIVNCV